MRDETINLTVQIPRDLHRKFKLACIAGENTMQNVLEAFMREFIKNSNVRGVK